MTFPIVYRENRRGVYRSFDRGKLYDVHATIAFSWHHFSIMDALCCTSSRSKNVYISWVQFNCRLSREASTTKIISHRSRKSNLIFSIFLREASPYNWMFPLTTKVSNFSCYQCFFVLIFISDEISDEIQ